MTCTNLIRITLLFTALQTVLPDEIFKEDLGDQMTIGLDKAQYKSAQLKCGSESMMVRLQTEEEFSGVIYTRGSFHEKNSPCFFDSKRGQKSFQIKVPLDQCNTKKIGNLYSNILVLQHDKELIMPGDVAFNLECDFETTRHVTVSANLQKNASVVSRITLSDADPSATSSRSKRNTIESYSDTVIITPKKLIMRKEEL